VILCFAQKQECEIVYNNQSMAERIKTRAKSQKIMMKNMLSDLELGINLVSHLAKGQNITAINLARIADYLDCSVDYLLGRTDDPLPSTNVIDGNVTGGAVVQGSSHSSVVVHNGGERALTEEEAELLRLFNAVDVKRRMKLLNLAFSLEEEAKVELQK